MGSGVVLATMVMAGTFALLVLCAQTSAQGPYESYFLYLGNHPTQRDLEWTEELQGIAHDRGNWFITRDISIYRIPVAHDLDDPICREPQADPPGICTEFVDGVSGKYIWEYPEMDDYNHFGDLDYYEYGGRGYVLIPVTGGVSPAIAVFSSGDTLDYVGKTDLHGQTGAGWCAIDSHGYVYSSNNHPWALFKYSLDWAALPSLVTMELDGLVDLLDENGAPLQLHHMQGGAFTGSGNLLYTVSGFLDEHYDNDGINVFDTRTWTRVRRSSTRDMPFTYEFHPGWDEYQEPEGLTIWDLNDGRAPGVSGTLHVLMLDNDEPFSGDDAYIKHYTEVIYVDGAYEGSSEEGRPQKPFKTVHAAIHHYPVWDGAQIKIQAGTYPEAVTFSQRIRLFAEGGTVVIGE
jgi:hypothetical protein